MANKSDGLLGGMVIGATLGAIAGILAAPRTGKETRHILKKSADALPELAEDLATSIQFQADRLSDTTLQNWDQTLARLREAIVAGQAASRQEWKKQQDVAQPEQAASYPSNQPSAAASMSVPSAAKNITSTNITPAQVASNLSSNGEQSTT